MNTTLDPTRHAAPQVVEALRAAIISLELEPGSALDRGELAQRFGVSQTPVRDALMRLSEEGLVIVRAQSTTQVSRIDVPAAREAHFLRRSIEIEIARLLALSHDPAVIAALRSQLARQVDLAVSKDYPAFIAADKEFHRLMYVAAGLPRLWAVVTRMSGHVDRLRLLHVPAEGKAESIMTGHQTILEAIESGDAEAAQHAVRDHLTGTLASVDEIQQRYPEYLIL
ncbi:DNA-binding GntR family transcriptional regulator [Pelomonas saccharophila]|uniref:DNA-binding GntR family transcriptional regulator n=1 Tax=Roseateles saccharophilus TaxID=304 RepID=A0ABU1YKQ4_ROSSA|nr:GntR family transcriptional regulator [Roseateles saccharophilus]MDR7269445.1 DNA-binding GntR family transcriptional regulator [Roseateles saccharophilus]